MFSSYLAVAAAAQAGEASSPILDWLRLFNLYYHLGDLPGWVPVANHFLLAVILLNLTIYTVLLCNSLKELRRQKRAVSTAQESDYLWVYVVPALNEEMVIADSVARLEEVQATHKIILAINDGSEDRTGEILAELQQRVPYLQVLTRVMPNARKGKGAGLDNAYHYINDTVLQKPEYRHWPAHKVIVGIVDADGRIEADAPTKIASVFNNRKVGGVQSLVRIYNRHKPITWAQDVEFAVTANVLQLGRSSWGTANMGGNGQYMRMSALDELVTTTKMPEGIECGPWRDRLTEDQDIGVRMVQTGHWYGTQTVLTSVHQQGLTNAKKLFRQRVRWAQGAWQCTDLLPGTPRFRKSRIAALDHVLYLLIPVLRQVEGLGFVIFTLTLLHYGVPVMSIFPALTMFLIVMFAPAFVALLITRKPGPTRVPRAIASLIPYSIYTWLLWSASLVALCRQLRGARTWAKTDREAIDQHPTDTSAGVSAVSKPLTTSILVPTGDSMPQLATFQTAA